MIKIFNAGSPCTDAWDYPVEELDYLLSEHDGESFVLINGRLYEMEDDYNG